MSIFRAKVHTTTEFEDTCLQTLTTTTVFGLQTDDSTGEGRVLIERSRSNLSNSQWCKCGQCEDSDKQRKICCRHIDKLEDRLETERCITATKDFQDVVLNGQVLLTVFIHVMLARRQRGAAPCELTP